MDNNKKNTDISVCENVYNTLKRKILYLEFRPGRALSVANLAELLHVSRTPVHDAILKLSEENLIDVFPKSGSRVSLIDIKKTEDERFMRKSMEMAALREMFYNYNESYVQKMEDCIVKHEKAFREKRYVDTLYWDGQFHSQIFACIGREYCWKICNQYSANEYRVRLLAQKGIKATQEAVLQNHRDLTAFLKARNLQAALNIEEQHLTRISTEITTLVASYPKLFTSTNPTSSPAKIRSKEENDENFLENLVTIH